MGLFSNIKKTVDKTVSNAAGNAVKTAVEKARSKDVVFQRIPETFEEFAALPQASMSTPEDTAAMTVIAFCVYPRDRELSLKMIDLLRGPRPLSNADKQFIRDRFMDHDYIPRSYLRGANPGNDYAPSEPLTVTVSSNEYSYQEEGYAKMHLTSGGADSPRQITLRKTKDGRWCLWEQYILVGIRQPESTNPWA